MRGSNRSKDFWPESIIQNEYTVALTAISALVSLHSTTWYLKVEASKCPEQNKQGVFAI